MWVLEPGYMATILLFAALQVALALVVLLRGARPIDAARVASCATLTLIGNTAFVIAILAQGASLFGLVMIAWVDLAFIAPACGLALCTRAWGRSTPVARGVAILAVAALPAAGWASLVEPFRLQVERPTLVLPQARAGTAPLRVAVLADLQVTRVGAFEREVIARLVAEQPDVILIPGDLFHGHLRHWPRALEDLRALLLQLEAPGGVYLVSGNAGYKQGLPELVEGTQVQLLVNRTVETCVRDRRLRVLGLEDAGFTRRIVADFEDRARADPEVIHVLLVHRPGAGVDAMADDSPIDVVVGGHTHGGQVALPFVGPPLTLSTLPRHMAAGGLHPIRGSHVYVSRGVGMERKWAPRVRFLCPPELTILTLE
ncbi:MAG: metallophosphoesterase [Planctomycetota bacterium]|nr:metallophosphoesterase [Planctomycetota bacterium]